MRQQTTIDAQRAARTPVNPAQDARINLVDLRVGNKPETFAAETHAAVDEELYLELAIVEANPLGELLLTGMNEPQKETSKAACVLADDAHERSCTPDDHETERSSEWIRDLETVSGRVGAGTQRTVPSDADAIAAVSIYGKQRSSLGGVGLVRQYEAQSSDTIKAATLAHNRQDSEWRRHVGLNATRLQVYEALKSEWKAMHQAYRQWGIADGNDTTPMEVGALMKGKGKNKGKGKGKEKGKDKSKEKGKGKSKDKAKEGTSDTSNVKCFFCKEKGHTPKDCPWFSAWLAEKKTVGHEQSANSIEEDGWILALDQEHEELCELIMIDSGASVHVCPPDYIE